MSMARNPISTLFLVLILVTAGCSGLFPSDDTGSPSSTAPLSYEEAVRNHHDALRAAGQFKIREVTTKDFDDERFERVPLSREVVADLESDQYWFGAELEGHNGVYSDGPVFQSGSLVYQRNERDNGSVVYRRVQPEDPFRVSNLTFDHILIIERISLQFPLNRNGTAIFQGQDMTRYTADEMGSAQSCVPSVVRERVETITDVRVVALVDDAGIVRKFECTMTGELFDGEQYTGRRVLTITGVGNVVVRPPQRLVNRTPSG